MNHKYEVRKSGGGMEVGADEAQEVCTVAGYKAVVLHRFMLLFLCCSSSPPLPPALRQNHCVQVDAVTTKPT